MLGNFAASRGNFSASIDNFLSALRNFTTVDSWEPTLQIVVGNFVSAVDKFYHCLLPLMFSSPIIRELMDPTHDPHPASAQFFTIPIFVVTHKQRVARPPHNPWFNSLQLLPSVPQ
jgi:hypothetical protein